MNSVQNPWIQQMKYRFIGVFVLIVTAAVTCSAPAELYMVQVGDGSTALGNNSAAVSVLKWNDDATTLLSTIPLPVADSGAQRALTLTGNGTSEGALTLSTDGQYLTMAGYGLVPGTTGSAATPSGSTTASANRVVGRITLSNSAVDTSTVFTEVAFSGGSFRSAITTNGTDIWATGAGTNGGVRYTTLGTVSTPATPSVQLTTAITNMRVANIVNNQLYTSAMSGTFRGVSTVGAAGPPIPTTSGQTLTLLNGFDPSNTSNESAYDFWFKDANTLYVADDRVLAQGGGMQKWELTAGTWTLAYTLDVGAGTRGLAGTIVSGNAVLYATTADTASRLVKITDTGAASVSSTLLTASTNYQFRGVEFINSAPAGTAGDYNNNGTVDAADYVLWRNGGPLANDPNPGNPTAQYNQWVANFNKPNPGTGSSLGAVPEPTSIALVLLGYLGFISGRRRK